MRKKKSRGYCQKISTQEKTRKDIKKPATEVWGDEDRVIRQKFMPTERAGITNYRGHIGLHPKFRSYADSTGYSTADDVKYSTGRLITQSFDDKRL